VLAHYRHGSVNIAENLLVIRLAGVRLRTRSPAVARMADRTALVVI